MEPSSCFTTSLRSPFGLDQTKSLLMMLRLLAPLSSLGLGLETFALAVCLNCNSGGGLGGGSSSGGGNFLDSSPKPVSFEECSDVMSDTGKSGRWLSFNLTSTSDLIICEPDKKLPEHVKKLGAWNKAP